MAVRREDYTIPNFLIEKTELDVKLSFEETKVSCVLSLQRREAAPTDLILNGGKNLTLHSLSVGTDPVSKYTILENGDLKIDATGLPHSRHFTVNFVVTFSPEENSSLEGLYKSDDLLVSQCEAEGFRNIAYFIDRPDVLSTYIVRLEASKTAFPILLCNGEKIAIEENLPDGKHAVTYHDPFPKPSYLFAIVAGKLSCETVRFVRCTGEPVNVNMWCEPRYNSRLTWALECVVKAMRWDEERFGRVYDLPEFNIVAVSHFNVGAMENKSLNIFNAVLLLADKNSADDFIHEEILATVGHEYFHNWTGNRVTCRDWFQLTLKEGLTNFREFEFVYDTFSRATHRIFDVRSLKTRQFTEDAGPLAHPIRPDSYDSIDNFYTNTIYTKGNEVIRMYQTILGVDGFRKGMDLYFKRHDGQAVTCDDFLAAMADANSVDLSQFSRWYSQKGTPVVRLLSMQATTDGLVMTLTQSGEEGALPLHIPVVCGLLCRTTGKELANSRVLNLTQSMQTFVFGDVQIEDVHDVVPSLLRDFSAPVRLDTSYLDSEALLVLLTYDTDPVNRYDAGQSLIARFLVRLANGEVKLEESDWLIDVLGRVLMEASDGRWASQAAMPPTWNELLQYTEEADPMALQAARDSFRLHMARKLQKLLRSLFTQMKEELKNRPYEITKEDVSSRAVKAFCLSFLGLLDGPAALLREFKEACCLNDREAALRQLCRLPPGTVEREEALKATLEAAAEDSLLIRRWASIQASADCGEAALDNVKALWANPMLDLKNPNLIRAVVRSFTQVNVQFHRADGKGYDWLADRVMDIDAYNPHCAADCARALTEFNQFDEMRQNAMKSALQKIIRKEKKLSKNLREIVVKASLFF